MGAAREEAARAEERYEGGKRRLADVAHEIREMLEVEPAEVANLAGIEPDRALPDVAEVETNLERLRRDRERLGAVNLRAEEELREVETQHGTLTTERDDLVEAIKRLRQGIQNLNREARERLLAVVRSGQQPLQASVQRAVRRRHRRAAADRERRSARSRPRDRGQAARARSRRRCRCFPAASRRSPRWR